MSGSGHVVLADEVGPDGSGLWRAVLKMGWPTVIAGLLRSSYAIIDTWSAGHVSTAALGGLTAAVFFAWMFHSLSALVSVGALSAVAQARGRGDVDHLRATTHKSLRLALGVGAAASAVLFVGAPVALEHMDIPPTVLREASLYIRILAVFGPAFWVYEALEHCFRGAGDPRTPLRVGAVVALLNLVLNPALALGLDLGVVGLAVSTVIAWLVGAVWLYVRARRAHLLDPSSSSGATVYDIIKVGLPVAMTGVAFDLIWTVLTPLVATNGAVALAAIGVGHRLEALSYMSAHGVGAACASLVGQAMGMGRPDLARVVTWRATVLGVSAVGLWAFAQLAFAEPLYGLFTSDPVVASLGAEYIAFAALPMLLQAVELIVLGGFEGMGKTWLPTAISFTCYTARIPLAFSLVEHGVHGVFLTVAITALASGSLVSVVFVLFGPARASVAHAPRETALVSL